MPGDGVAVDEQHALTLADLKHRGNVDRDRRLAHAALGVEHDDDLAAAGVGVVHRRSIVGIDDTAGGIVGGDLGANEHRLDPPAQRLGGVGAGEILVADAGSSRQPHPVEGSGRHDHQRRDVAALIVEESVHLDRPIEVVLPVQDGNADVVALDEKDRELFGGVDRDRVVAGLHQLRADGSQLCRR